MSPVPYTWGPFLAKIFLKIWFCKIDPFPPPHIDFNTIPYFTYGYPYRGVKEGKLKKGPYLHFWAPPVQWWGQSRKLDNFLTT